MFEHKAYITVRIATKDEQDYESSDAAFQLAIKSFFAELNKSVDNGTIKGYDILDVETK